MEDYPIEYDEKTLDEMYSELRLHLSDERIELLRQYFDAMNSFYMVISLKKMLRIINSQNEEQYSEEDFLAFAEIARHERHFYYILGMEELYEEEPKSKPIERELVHESLLEFDNYYDLAEAKYEKPYFVPDKDELLKYADDFYEEKTAQYCVMAEFVRKNIDHRAEYTEDVMSEMLFIVKSEESSPEEAINFLETSGAKFKLTKALYEEFSKLYYELHNNTRLPCNNGFTPSELFARTGDERESYYLRAETPINVLSNKFSCSQPIKSQKVGRNEPCPCGSGKKYKKCCGR